MEEVLLFVGEQVGHKNLSFASRMNKAVVVFLKEKSDREWRFYQRRVCPGVPIVNILYVHYHVSCPFHNLLENELSIFGNFAGTFKVVSLGCRDPKLKHVQSLRRQVFVFFF